MYSIFETDDDLKSELKTRLLENIPNLQFNSQRYYISLRKKRNFAFLKIRKKKIGIIAMLKEENLKEKINHHEVTTLTESVQKFYNGPCARIEIFNKNKIEEIVELLMSKL